MDTLTLYKKNVMGEEYALSELMIYAGMDDETRTNLPVEIYPNVNNQLDLTGSTLYPVSRIEGFIINFFKYSLAFIFIAIVRYYLRSCFN